MIGWGSAPPLSLALALLGTAPPTPYPVARVAEHVYVVPGDIGRGSEGRPNAGFVVTDSGVVVIDAEGSPYQGTRLLAAIRTVTDAPIRYLILTHHHPDHTFGAIVFTRAGARVIAHPDRRTLSSENGDDDQLANWDRVVGLRELQGFAFADTPNIPVARDTTIRVGGLTLELDHPPNAHTAGDLTVWIPGANLMFAGDLVVEDGVTMVVDGSSAGVLSALDRIESHHPKIVIPGHGRIDPDPGAQIALTRHYLDSTRTAMQNVLGRNEPLARVLRRMPPPDSGRPVSLASRRQRNAVIIYAEMEKQQGVSPGSGSRAEAPVMPGLISTDSLAHLPAATIIDVRTDIALYLKSHIPGAIYLNSETLRSWSGGVPNMLLPAESYLALWNRLGIRPDRPVVVYSAGDTRDIDATFLSWILSGFGAPRLFVLDGGFQKWDIEQRPIARTYAAAVPGAYPARPFAPERANIDDVRAVVEGRAANTILVDARPADQYAGQAGAQLRRGHIPGAIDHYWATDLADNLTHEFKDREALRASYLAQGITPDHRLILYCNGATEASHVYFVLRDLLGYPNVRIYEGSWTEWAARTELPITAGPTP
jgi:thiosulfate/3-mercaptopyruvate sulfurtransferase